MKFKTGKENKQKRHFDASKIILLEKFNKTDSNLFECHFIFQEKTALPRECMNKEKGLIWEGQKQKPKQTNTFLHKLFTHIASVWLTIKPSVLYELHARQE